MDFTTVIEFKNSHLHEKNKVISKSQQVFFGFFLNLLLVNSCTYDRRVQDNQYTHANMHVTGRLKKGLYMEFCDKKKAFLIYLPNLHKSYTF